MNWKGIPILNRGFNIRHSYCNNVLALGTRLNAFLRNRSAEFRCAPPYIQTQLPVSPSRTGSEAPNAEGPRPSLLFEWFVP